MKWINAFFSTCIFLCVLSIPSLHGHTDEAKLLQQADSLYQLGHHQQAALLCERVFYFSSESSVRALANLQKARTLKQLGEFAKARNDLQRSLFFRDDEVLQRDILYELALLDHLSGNFMGSQALLQQYQQRFPNNAHEQRLWLLQTLNNNRMGLYEDVEKACNRLLGNATIHPELKDSLLRINQQLFKESSIPRLKSPQKAANWSTFIPGSGHVYAGYPVKGMINAFSQLTGLGLFAYMAWNQMYVSGFVVGLGMFQSFYFGGVRQAAHLAEQANALNSQGYQVQLTQHIIYLAQFLDVPNH